MNEIPSPYQPPQACLDSGESDRLEPLTPRALTHLRDSWKWMAVAAMLGATAGALHFILPLSGSSGTAGEESRFHAADPLMPVVVVGVLLLAVLPSWWRAGGLIRRAAASGHAADSVAALRAHRLCWQRLGGALLALLMVLAGAMVWFLIR